MYLSFSGGSTLWEIGSKGPSIRYEYLIMTMLSLVMDNIHPCFKFTRCTFTLKRCFILIKRCSVLKIIIHLHNSSLQPFSQDYDLASHTTYVVCVHFRHEWCDLHECRLRTTAFWGTFHCKFIYFLRFPILNKKNFE